MSKENNEEEKEEPIDWENLYDEIKSSEVNEITLEFNTNGSKVRRKDDKGAYYNIFKFKGIRLDISNPSEVTYTTSSKRLMDELQDLKPLKGKKLHIVKKGSSFQTTYQVKEL